MKVLGTKAGALLVVLVLVTGILVSCADAGNKSTMRLATRWRGIPVAEEDRCSPYKPGKDYNYSPTVEERIADRDGMRSPYDLQEFSNLRQSDIEHVVARSEAHDSGLCTQPIATRRAFANDLANLVLASPGLNRHQKRDKDAAEWLPERNRCWYAGVNINIRRKYGLTIDRAEADALEALLEQECGGSPAYGIHWSD